MAKQQTFQDKAKKKSKADEQISVKVVLVDRSERGTYKFAERFVKVKDLGEVEQQVGRA
jgi:hypothetical protein